jgi:hypothetical protein
MPATPGIKTRSLPARNHVKPRESAVFELVFDVDSVSRQVCSWSFVPRAPVHGGLSRNGLTMARSPIMRPHLRFGKGTGHGAVLNYGDCFAYGLAKAMDAPLLRKGNDFPLTEIGIA